MDMNIIIYTLNDERNVHRKHIINVVTNKMIDKISCLKLTSK